MPPANMTAAPTKYPTVSGPRWVPFPTRELKMAGAAAPPMPRAAAKKNEMAWARSSSGKISLAVRYAEEAPATTR